MSKKMMVNATHPEENRVAIVEDGILTDLDIEVAGREPSKGNIYKAVVVRVETGLQAAFVDYGAERMGFLQIDEINYTTVKPDYKPAEDGRRPRINDLLHRGQEILVQITKEERGTKGAALTTYLSLAGRYMVLMPGSTTRGVSRKAESDAQRKELKKAMASLDLAEGVGYIVRTAALDQTREELDRDYRYLIRLFESIKELEQKSKAPALIYKESNLMIRSIRDYFTTDMDEVLIDDTQVFKEAKDFFQMVMPDQVKLVKLHQERRPIFSRYQIEDQIETLSRNKVALPSGGSIVIDPTEALVAIDVNSGKMASEKGVEATATKANLEAAAEVGRQLRLRDLGGLIVIDFIDMRDRKNNRLVENQLKKSLENDKARVNVGRISKFGLMEMSRQRIKATLTQASHLPCPHCNGTGELKSPETQAVALLRKIHASAAKGQVSRVDAQLPLEVAAYLLNNNREELVDMERRYQLQIHIHGNRDFLADQVEIEIQKKEKAQGKPTQPEYVAAGTLPMVIAEDAKQETDKSSQAEPTEAAAEPAKKRRRRRRRKPAAASSTGEAQTTEESPAGAQEATPESDSTDAPDNIDAADKTAETAAESTETKPPAKRPQRRRRSSRSKSTAKETETTTNEAAPTATEVPAIADKAEEAAADGQDVAETKPKRRRSRRKPKAAEDTTQAETVTDASTEQAEPPTQSVASTKAAESTVDQAEADKPAAATKPKPRRPRRPAKKPEAETAADSTQDKAAEQTPPEQAVAEEKPAPKKPASRSRKKSDAAQPAKEAEPANEAKADEKQTAPQPAAETVEKPKRSRTSRAKPKPEVSETTADASATTDVKPKEDQAKADKVAEEKPVKKAPVRRATKKAPTKKSPVKKAKPAEAAAESVPKTDKKAEKAAEEKPKPKRRRTVKKKPAEAESDSKD
ncbi:MAG: Rne/Rng family ribonuclease [Desulfuromonadales bacterium]|nr:Rne/Rng family ribonuclease [Desulfuromonadales bacterium]